MKQMKRIILCADGTWNEPGQVDGKTGKRKPTNVLKIARAILPTAKDGTAQVVYYLEGIGANAGLDKWTDGAFGKGMEHNVRALYRFLVYNYEPGDEIFFFGFSRGAFTVRTLAGFMNKVGLLDKDDEYFTPDLYTKYQQTDDPIVMEKVSKYIHTPRPCPDIKFIGVWDTVGALGAPGLLGQLFNKNKYQYHDISLHPAIKNAYHAMAIDERRKPFKPSMFKISDGWSGNLEQAWFPGVHSNVGGGYHPDGLANEALQWMAEKAENLGLEYDTAYLDRYLPCFNSEQRDSMTMMYKVSGPFVRVLGKNSHNGEAIHQSALDRMNLAECNYTPKNLKACLADCEPKVCTTGRVPRGTPCPPLN